VWKAAGLQGNENPEVANKTKFVDLLYSGHPGYMGLAAIVRDAIQYFNNRLFDLAIMFLLLMVEWYTHQSVISAGKIQDSLCSAYHDAR
jgi:hypothetical protein